MGCDFEQGRQKQNPGAPTIVGVDPKSSNPNIHPSLRKTLPRVFIDGPFGSASEDVFKYEIAVLIGAGIGVTPFASILSSIWYRMSKRSQQKTRLRKVYFFWVCRDFGSFEWFRSLLTAIEAQDIDSHIEIHTVSDIMQFVREPGFIY